VNEFLTVVAAVFPVMAVACAGIGLRLRGWLTEEADASLLRVTINLLVPCLILDALIGNEALTGAGNLLLPPLVGFSTILIAAGVAILGVRFTGLTEPVSRRTFIHAVTIQNYGYIPIPLALLLFNRETMGVLFLHNVGVETGLWTVGLALLRGGRPGEHWKRILNPPLAAIVGALLINGVRAMHVLPVWVHPPAELVMVAARMLGQCAIPMGLLLIGATMADHRHAFSARRGMRFMVLACALRVGLIPLLLLQIPTWLPMSVELQEVVVLEAAMPAAVFSVVMAKHYGGDMRVSLGVVVSTSLAGLATIPLWIRFGLHFLGLPS